MVDTIDIHDFVYLAPTRVLFGAGKLDELAATPLPGKKALVVTTGGNSVKANGYLDRLERALDAAGVDHVLFDRIEPNPLRATVNAGGWMALCEGCDFVVALGGGSVMDGCKAICTMAANPSRDADGTAIAGDIWDYMKGGTAKGLPIPSEPLPLVCIPTTAGTGSEVDAGGIISCEETDEKLRLGDPRLFPALAVIDPELMLTVPPRLTAFQGFDALFHSIECFIACNHMPMGDMFCREGIYNAARALTVCVNDGSNLEARTRMAYASMLGGYGMACTGCCGCHGTEHGMSAHHHDLPHGAGLICIAHAYHQHMIEVHACDDRYIEMARLMGNEAATKPADFLVELDRLLRECDMNQLAMSDWGITRDELPAIAHNAVTTNDALFAHDPVELTEKDVTAILAASWR